MGSIFWRRVLSARLGVMFLGAGQLGPRTKGTGPDSSRWTGPWAHPHGTPGPRPPSVAHRFRLYLAPACPVGREERQPHPLQDEPGRQSARPPPVGAIGNPRPPPSTQHCRAEGPVHVGRQGPSGDPHTVTTSLAPDELGFLIIRETCCFYHKKKRSRRLQPRK